MVFIDHESDDTAFVNGGSSDNVIDDNCLNTDDSDMSIDGSAGLSSSSLCVGNIAVGGVAVDYVTVGGAVDDVAVDDVAVDDVAVGELQS